MLSRTPARSWATRSCATATTSSVASSRTRRPRRTAHGTAYRMVTSERDVGLMAMPAGWARRLDAVAGKLQYRHISGIPAWAPIENVHHETSGTGDGSLVCRCRRPCSRHRRRRHHHRPLRSKRRRSMGAFRM
eukprot:6321092-Alexandrium_andersonii.AAC.2